MEFFINEIISAILTFINVIFIFAIVMLKIKEITTPYIFTPDIRRYWQKGINITRNYNKSFETRNSKTTNTSNREENEMATNNEDLGCVLEAALREAADDDTFKKVRRIGFSNQANDEISQDLLSETPPTSSIHINSPELGELNFLKHQMSSLIASLNIEPTSSLNRLHSLSKSFRINLRRSQKQSNLNLPTILEMGATADNIKQNISEENAY